MHITDITIVNFRGIKKLYLEPGSPVLLLTGRNGTGKTTVLDAVRFVLTGIVRDQSGAALKLERIIGPYASKAEVTVGLSDGVKELCVSVTASSTAATVKTDPVLPGGNKEKRDAMWKYFGLNPEHERLALDPLALLLGTDLLESLAGNTGVTDTQMQDVFGENAGRVAEVLKGYQLSLANTSDVTPVVDAVYKIRTEINRESKTTETLLKANSAVQPVLRSNVKMTEADVPKAQAQIRELLGKRHELDGQIARAESGRTQAQIDADVKRIMAEQAALKKREIKPPMLPKEPKGETTIEELQAMSENYQKAKGKVSVITVDRDNLNELIGVLEMGECPVCKHTASPEIIAEQEQKLASMNAERVELIAGVEAIKGLFDAYAALHEKNCEAVRAWQRECMTMQSAHERDVKDAERDYKHEQQRLETELKRLEAEQPAEDVTALEAERESTQHRAEQGQELLDQWRLWTKKQELTDTLAKQKQTSEFLSYILKRLEDPAVLKTLGNDGSMAFEIQMNDVLGMFGYRVRVNWEQSRIEMSEDAIEVWRSMAEVSAGELTIVQVAVADVYGGTGLALIDRFEGVDGENARTVWNLLRVPVGGRVIAQTGAVNVPGITCVNMEETEAA
jgi:hypothetical protein